jgi:very-short-patch-repair endonuclease
MTFETFQLHCRARGMVEPVAEWRFHPTRRWRFDWAWPDRKLALEIDGGLWQPGGGRHNRGVGYVKDLEKLNEATILGWRVLRVQPQDMTSGRGADLVARALKER